MASFEQVINSPQVELVPGSGFSALRILQLICRVWNPSGGRAATVHQVLCGYLYNILNGISDPATRAAFCDAITADGFDDELDGILAEAISYAAAEVLGTIGDAAGLISTNCIVSCGPGGGSVDIGNLVQEVVEIAMSSYSGDGVDWGGLGTALVDTALTQAACCVVTAGMSLAARAAMASRRIGLSKALGRFREACKELLAAEEQVSGGSSGGEPGWGQPPSPAPGPVSPPPQPPLVWKPNAPVIQLPAGTNTPASPVVTAPPPPPPPAEGKSWLPLALTIAGTGVASILIVRRRPRLRRR